MGLFGRKSRYSIGAYSREEQDKLSRLYEKHVYPHLGGALRNEEQLSKEGVQRVSELAVQALQKAAEIEPDEFIWHFVLGDHYIRLGRLSDAVRACQRAVNTKPDDPRSEYALATSYRMLTRAMYAGPQYAERIEFAKQTLAQSPAGTMAFEFDPDAAASELEQLDMTWQEAAKESLEHFRRALEIGFSKSDNTAIEQTIEMIRLQCLQQGVSI